MVEISNIGAFGDNGGNEPKKTKQNTTKQSSVNAFDEYRRHQQEMLRDYKDFQQSKLREYENYVDDQHREFENFRNQAQEDFNNFRNEAHERFQSFRDSVMGKKTTPEPTSALTPEQSARNRANEEYIEILGNSDNWKEYEAQKPIPSPLEGKPDTAPIYKPDLDGADDIQGTEPLGQFEESTAVEPTSIAKPKPVLTKPIVLTEPTEPAKPVEPQHVDRKGVTGTYTLTPGKNGKGFSLSTNMTVSFNGEAAKFFHWNPLQGNDINYDDKTKLYSFRGISGKNRSIVQRKMTMAAQNVSMNNAIYNDLLTKQKSGTELTDAEKSFIDYHLSNIKRYGLGVDAQGNLIDISK